MASTPTADITQITTAMESLNPNPTTIQDLKNRPSLWYKVHVFVYDLRNFREIPESQVRLDRIAEASYIGMPCFESDEAEILKAAVVDGEETLESVIQKTLNERLERRIKKRVESGDHRVCAAHDLAPIFEKAFDIKPKELAKDSEFLAIIGRSGLKLKGGDNWKGLSKKSFQKKNKKKH